MMLLCVKTSARRARARPPVARNSEAVFVAHACVHASRVRACAFSCMRESHQMGCNFKDYAVWRDTYKTFITRMGCIPTPCICARNVPNAIHTALVRTGAD